MTEILTRTFAADHTTPVRAYAALRAQSPGRSSFLLESVLPGERWGRYSILGYRARTENAYPANSMAMEMLAEDVSKLEDVEGLAARFSQALVGYVSYDVVHSMHGIKPWPTDAMVARLMRDATVVVFDNLTQTMTIAGRTKGAIERCAWEMTHGPELEPMAPPAADGEPLFLEVNVEDEAYGMRVMRAKEYIAAGDCFQVVLARTFRAPMRNADPFDVYRALRVLSPSPYLYFLDFAETPFAEGLQIAGASPETMVRVANGRMTLRPIAGTRRRGDSFEEDEGLAQELINDPKERAEHVMLVDLARNDAGRVCTAGSVELTENMVVERYSHVMHIVSEVSGELRPDVTVVDAVRSAFPAGTLSGAPKVRATQIIRELESAPRGVYGGAIGYFAPDKTVDLAIAIRTVVARRGEFEVTAGAGIVEGSVPEAEAQETRSKARAALAAIRFAQDAADRREAREEAKRAKAEAEERAKAEAERAAAEKAEAENAASSTSEGGEGQEGSS
ncbi:anthranilate synthase component I family protein [Polyangium aurulentum]|uniref:anthranilate synthase component I family protein n=1 Tax=Polyangium aurulentum TaxID=2567896 RepID=UPI0010AE1961|nr:chorismate-binding protein [Polyangium aurulentum]UQA61740.1 chorismate-binding protein [Polyangium aurulentum]